LDVVDQLDLGPFLRGYRADGHGHPAYDPKTLLGVLLYAYATGARSSRQIQRRCTEDLAFRVLAANQTPDHVTIARFRVRHQHALAGFLVESLRLCAAAGLVRLGVVAKVIRYLALACSYDETIAVDGRIDQPTEAGLQRLVASGRQRSCSAGDRWKSSWPPPLVSVADLTVRPGWTPRSAASVHPQPVDGLCVLMAFGPCAGIVRERPAQE
jgi:hypothetical protein